MPGSAAVYEVEYRMTVQVLKETKPMVMLRYQSGQLCGSRGSLGRKSTSKEGSWMVKVVAVLVAVRVLWRGCERGGRARISEDVARWGVKARSRGARGSEDVDLREEVVSSFFDDVVGLGISDSLRSAGSECCRWWW